MDLPWQSQGAEEDLLALLESLKFLAYRTDFLSGDMAQRHGILDFYVKKRDFVELAYVVDAKGVQSVPNAKGDGVLVTYQGDGLGQDLSQRPWFKAAAGNGRPYITRGYVSIATHNVCLTLAIPVYRDGDLVAVVAADVNVLEADNLENKS
jgi:hypothetical protein